MWLVGLGCMATVLSCGGSDPTPRARGEVAAIVATPVPSTDPFAPPRVETDPLAPPGADRAPRHPSLLQRAATRVRNAYVLKLAPGAPTGPRSRWARTVERIGELGATTPFHVDDEATAERLDLGRWRTFRSPRPYEDVVSRLETHSDIAWVEAVVRLVGTREAAERDIPGVTTIRALASPDDPSQRTITSLVLAERVIAAVDAGATTVWVPWMGLEHTEVVAEACAYARERGVSVVAPVGDQGYTDFVATPAALDTTLAVGAEALDATGAPIASGNRGPGLDLVYPAADSLVASADVAGVIAALPWMGDRVGPPDLRWRPRAIERRLVASALDRGPIGWDPGFGHGRVDPEAARAWRELPPEDPLIVAHRVERRSGHRAVLSWVTSVPATTEVRWDGDSAERDALTLTHRMVVAGRPGDVRRYAIVSRAGARRERERVTVQF